MKYIQIQLPKSPLERQLCEKVEELIYDKQEEINLLELFMALSIYKLKLVNDLRIPKLECDRVQINLMREHKQIGIRIYSATNQFDTAQIIY